METLSIIIPAYNEEKTISLILDKIRNVNLKNTNKQVIIVNDHSSDGTEKQVLEYKQKHPSFPIHYLCHSRNQGKGAAIRTGIKQVEGDYVIIQDADLEYDPEDYNMILNKLSQSGGGKVVYGSRFLLEENKHSYQTFYLGGRLVTFITNLLYDQNLTDEPTCYKAFHADLLKSIPLECRGFEFCPEVTAKIALLGYQIEEVPIHYYPRSIEEGKKIKWTDGLEAIYVLVKIYLKNILLRLNSTTKKIVLL